MVVQKKESQLINTPVAAANRVKEIHQSASIILKGLIDVEVEIEKVNKSLRKLKKITPLPAAHEKTVSSLIILKGRRALMRNNYRKYIVYIEAIMK